MWKIDEAVTLADVRVALRDALKEKYGEREAAAMARLTMMHLKGWDLPHLMANEGREASDYVKGRTEEILDNLLKNMPLQYALGETEFYGLRLKVDPGVLIPRPETEELVEMIVRDNPQSDLRVLDLCTGSGAIAVALARNLPFSEVTAVDVSPRALVVAGENSKNLKTNVSFELKDIFKWMPAGEWDIIVSNPPYVNESEKEGMDKNVLDYEPHIALFVPDDDPLVFYRRIAEIGRSVLKPGGGMYLEINPRHSEELRKLMEKEGMEEVEIVRDIHGKDRFLKARMK